MHIFPISQIHPVKEQAIQAHHEENAFSHPAFIDLAKSGDEITQDAGPEGIGGFRGSHGSLFLKAFSRGARPRAEQAPRLNELCHYTSRPSESNRGCPKPRPLPA